MSSLPPLREPPPPAAPAPRSPAREPLARRVAAGTLDGLRALGRNWFNLLLLGGLQIAFYWYFVLSDTIQVHLKFWSFIEVLATTVLLFVLLNSALSLVPWRRARAGVNLFLQWFFALLIAYRWARGAPLDFGLLTTNLSEIASPDGWMQVWEGGGVFGWALLGAVLAAGVLAEWRWRSLSTVAPFRRPVLVAVALLAANWGVVAAPIRYPNEVVVFARSAIRFFKMPDLEAESLAGIPDDAYPLHREFQPSKPLYAPDRRPNVILVMMESFTSEFVGKTTPDGRPVTPFFDSLVRRGQYHDRFFSNSMQTERGHSTLTCSIIPSYRQKIMRYYEDVRLSCLPAAVRDAGYVTLFAQAQPDITYDNTGPFMEKAGFDHVLAMDERFVGPEDKPYVWGWGLQDDRFYAKTLDYVDDLERREPGRSYFLQLANVSNHMRFDWMPRELKRLYPDPETFLQKYHNSQNLADEFLRRLFDEIDRRPYLRDRTLVILVGDHGFPAGQHGNTSNEVGWYDELFRVPLLLVGPDVQPWRNRTVAYSQLDVGPTVLEWLGIATPTAFQGRAIPWDPADLPAEQSWIPLVQPYDGGWVMGVRWPVKYGRSLSADDEFLFDLEADPMERRNRIGDWPDAEGREEFRRSVLPIFRNQRLLDQDRLVPP